MWPTLSAVIVGVLAELGWRGGGTRTLGRAPELPLAVTPQSGPGRFDRPRRYRIWALGPPWDLGIWVPGPPWDLGARPLCIPHFAALWPFCEETCTKVLSSLSCVLNTVSDGTVLQGCQEACD